MKKTIVLLLLAIFSVGTVSAQRTSWKDSRHSIYLGGGLNWFNGDIDPTNGGEDGPSFKLLKNGSCSFTAGYKYKLSERFSFRLSALYSKITGDDADSKDLSHQKRGVNFVSHSFEFDANLDFYFIKEKEKAKYHFWDRWSSYIFVGAGLLTYNPKWNGNNVGSVKKGDKLRDLKTETVGYHKATLAVPGGLGLKFLITKKVSLGMELAVRYTTSDHIDDLHGFYNFETQGAKDLNFAGASQGARRGGDGHNDWYSTLLFNLGIKFGGAKPPMIHFYHRPKYY
ncbi:MAG: outer membrane beta-barrel protein [Bacteroidales bacterium]|nr:outer membrane beta-barrel protein [Bacteroidales bacterium]